MAEVGAALERWQVQVYLAAIGLGVLVGLVSPGVGSGLEQAVSPLIAAVLVVNFVVVPVVVAALLPLLPDDRALRLDVLLVLLCPCVDWVVVFGGLGGARRVQLLAVTPLLLVTQLVLLPGYLRVLFGPELGDVVRVGPFLSAFAWLIAVPQLRAWLVQAGVARRPRGWFAAAAAGTDVAMVPLLAATLLAVITSQLPRLRAGGGGGGGGPTVRPGRAGRTGGGVQRYRPQHPRRGGAGGGGRARLTVVESVVLGRHHLDQASGHRRRPADADQAVVLLLDADPLVADGAAEHVRHDVGQLVTGQVLRAEDGDAALAGPGVLA
ncbi:hypothetical protein MXD61_24285 [Frankia sp. AgPm24]|uniref:hypothetical protein n=1 Tax=Frankia sp. AgPm24 TaxID=631128 RepID=UPI00200C9ABD|nr:hypothetical protein [Frankia sp. AgPm24]MCK9924947.1 hypothetical protein [Frankia sp. AgPm24]